MGIGPSGETSLPRARRPSLTPGGSIRSGLELLRCPTLQRLDRPWRQLIVRAIELQAPPLGSLGLTRRLLHEHDSSSERSCESGRLREDRRGERPSKQGNDQLGLFNVTATL